MCGLSPCLLFDGTHIDYIAEFHFSVRHVTPGLVYFGSIGLDELYFGINVVCPGIIG